MDKWHDNSMAELTRLRLCLEKEVEEEKASQSTKVGDDDEGG